MTDKVQKNREEVEGLFNHVKDSNFESDSGAFYYLKDLLDFIDSLQEEPVNKVDVDAAMAEVEAKAKTFTGSHKGESSDEILAQMRGEESVSEEWVKELRAKLDSLSKEDLKKVFDKYAVDFNEEPISEDLEEAATNYATHLDENWSTVKDGYIAENEKAAFKAGAEWGKEQSEMQIKAQSIALAHGCSKEESVSEDLEEASKKWLEQQLDKSYANYGEAKMMELTHFDGYAMLDAIEFGANWQKATLWKPANGDDLPEYDREVIAILDYDFGHYKVIYAHRPNPNGWNGTNIDTGEREHFEPVIYDKGGWNQPHVLYWLDTKLPYEEKN